MDIKESTYYSGEYRDISFSIVRFDNPLKDELLRGSDFSWCHYIYLNLDKQIEDKKIADSLWLNPKDSIYGTGLHYDYYTEPISHILFHGGCTWYSKESSEDEKERRVKIGCDYQHFWNTGKNYNLEHIKQEVKATIDSFLKNVSPVLRHCSGCGVFYKDVTKNGCGKCEYSQDKY